ncbi:DUF2993 domain-containing protein [Cellulomonas fimi]|uniref:LmeA family phospholipid-binding protein n=1 Tax=Cellulomonas sp. RIT-PI-Y TaxID=3035297 RepID=UPI0021D9BC26
MSADRRRRRGCLVTFVLALVLLAGGALLAEFASRALVQSLATDALRNGLNTDTSISVDVPEHPVLPQLIRGELRDVRVDSDVAQIRGVDIVDVEASATGVRIRGERGADQVVVTATLPSSTLQTLLSDRTGWDLQVAEQDGELVLSGEALGVPLTVNLQVTATDGALTATITQTTIGGLTVDAVQLPLDLSDQLGNLAGITDQLAAQATITDAQVVDGGLRVTLNLQDVLLDDL